MFGVEKLEWCGYPAIEDTIRKVAHRMTAWGRAYISCTKKGSHLMFDNNFRKCRQIFTIHSPIHEKILYTYTPHLRYVATLHCESRKYTVSETVTHI